MGKTATTASMLYGLASCPHRVTMNLVEDPAKRDPVSAFVELLSGRGSAVEPPVETSPKPSSMAPSTFRYTPALIGLTQIGGSTSLKIDSCLRAKQRRCELGVDDGKLISDRLR